MKEIFTDLGYLVVPWLLIILTMVFFMRGLDWFFEATRAKNIKYKKEMLAWMAGASALFCMGGWGLWEGVEPVGGAVVWFGFGGWVLWVGVKKWKERNELERTWELIISNPYSTAASDSYDAAYNEIEAYTTRANHCFEILNARHDETLDAEAYDETVAAYTDPADFAPYTEAELDAHTAAMEKLTAAFATINHPDGEITSTAAELYRVQCETYKFAVDAYSNAASCALGTALDGNLQAVKDEFQTMQLDWRAANPDEINPVAAKAKAASFKAQAAEDASKAKALKQKARVAETKAKELLAKVEASLIKSSAPKIQRK